ncbi:uncharacterized protein LOC118945315 isoform X1 [Oncorhynchus mykiss]|uniref:uncharacterized protein n=1 Tax=Oncorhynchus clarkii lewisi TaxID=490388 RepID=UPI001878F08D|nr:uncharacterized protein LOC118945315 isoform X1 [Oncorhynchus mykiss]
MAFLLALFLLTPFMAFKITTINVRSVKTATRAQSVLSFLERFNSDVFLLQECGLPFLSSYRKWEDKWRHGPSIWSGSNFNKNDGVAILIKTPQVVVKGSTVVDREPVCPVRGLAIGEPTTVWRNVAHPALLNRHRDLSWMVAHEILPVRAVMHSRGMARTSACPRPGCGQEESVRHMLWECRAARDLWKEAGPLITSCLPAGEDLTPQLVLYGVGRRPIPSKAFTKLWPTLTCLKEALWSSRNLLVAKNVETTPQAVAMVATEALGWYGRKGASTPGEGSPTTP